MVAIDGPFKLNFQLMSGTEPTIGPGKALVLETIAREGSISAAGCAIGRELLDTYRRVEGRMMAAAAGDDLDWLLAARSPE
jgi:molybdate transport system regulatory protein